MNGFIYVVGGQEGIDQASTINYCEKLDLQTRKWTLIQSCLKKSSFCQLATFSKRFIFKFGGKIDILNHYNSIEYYDTKEDIWKEISFSLMYPMLQIPQLCGAVQINRSQIMFFGGMVHEAKCTEAYILTVEKGENGINDQAFTVQRTSSLPK